MLSQRLHLSTLTCYIHKLTGPLYKRYIVTFKLKAPIAKRALNFKIYFNFVNSISPFLYSTSSLSIIYSF